MHGLRQLRQSAGEPEQVEPELALPAPGKRTLLARSVAHDQADERRVGKRTRVWVEACRSGRRGLPAALRGRLERALGRDLSALSVHDGPAADAGARDVRARAFTVGQDIFFAAGEYRPDDPAGQELIAHEVAHAVQQSGGAIGDELELSRPGDGVEHEADSFAESFARIPPDERLIEPARGPALVAPVAPVLLVPPPLVAAPSGISRALIARRPAEGAIDPDHDTPLPGPAPGPSGLFEITIPDFTAVERREKELFKRKLTDGMDVSLIDTTIPVNGVPVNLDAGFSMTPLSVRGQAGYGPLLMSNMKVFSDCPPVMPGIEFMGKGTLTCNAADFDASATISGGPKVGLGAVAGIFKLEAGVHVVGKATFKAKVEGSMSEEVNISAASPNRVTFGTMMHMRASAQASLSLGASLWVELSLNLPRLPILDRLNTALGGWPSRILKFIGLGDAGKLWSKRWSADWTPIEKTASTFTEGKLSLNVSKTGDGAATVSEDGDTKPLDLKDAMSALSGKKPDSDDLPKEGEDDKDNKPSALAGARARAASAVRGARSAIKREREANRKTREKWNAIPGHGSNVMHGGMGPPSDPTPSEATTNALDENDKTLDELAEGADSLDGAVSDLQGSEGEPAQAPGIKNGYDTVATNAHNLEGEAVKVEQPDVDGNDGGKEDEAAQQMRGHARGALDEVVAVLDQERAWARPKIVENRLSREPEIEQYGRDLGEFADTVEELRVQEYAPLDNRWHALGTTGTEEAYEAIRDEAVTLRDDLASTLVRPAEPHYDQAHVEFAHGKFNLREPWAGDIRRYFYEREGYGPTLAWRDHLLNTPRSAGGLRHETEANLWWYDHRGGGGWWDRSEATIAHESPTCAGHWNSEGRKSSQAVRTGMYRGDPDPETHLFIQPARINSEEGGRKLDGTYQKDVSGSWTF